MRAVIAFSALIRRPVQIAAAIVMAMSLTPAGAAEVINVIMDQAKIAPVPDRTATLVVGNPLIADVSVQAGGTMVLTGKGYGVTNVIALDHAGKVLSDKLVRVKGPLENVVVYRGTTREVLHLRAELRAADHARRQPGIFRDDADADRGAQQPRAQRPSPTSGVALEHLPTTLTLFVSLPGLTGQSSTHGRCLLDRPVKPGDDSNCLGRWISSNNLTRSGRFD